MPFLRLSLFALAGCVALFIGWSFLGGLNRFGSPSSPHANEPSAQAGAANISGALTPERIAAVRQNIEASLAATPEYDAFFQRLKVVYPAEYESILDAFSTRVAAGEGGGADLLLSEAAHVLRQTHGILAAKADDLALDRIFETQRAVLRALAGRDQRLCVDFLFGGESAAFLEFSAQNRDLVAAMALAGVEAMSDGQQKRVEREAPDPADFEILESALRDKGLATPEIEALLDGKANDPSLDDAKMCRAGQIYLDTLAALPEPARARIYALAVEIMARS
jgi:hypothetical protein